MTTEEFKTIIIKPEEGHYLTQVKDVDIKERIVSTTIAIGRHDSVDNYKEITKEEGDKIIEEQRIAAEEEMKRREEEISE